MLALLKLETVWPDNCTLVQILFSVAQCLQDSPGKKNNAVCLGILTSCSTWADKGLCFAYEQSLVYVLKAAWLQH